jgi:hypothetical protein
VYAFFIENLRRKHSYIDMRTPRSIMKQECAEKVCKSFKLSYLIRGYHS